MRTPSQAFLTGLRNRSVSFVTSPWLPAIFPALAFAGYLTLGEHALALLALGLPLVWLILLAFRSEDTSVNVSDPVTGFGRPENLKPYCDRALAQTVLSETTTICMMMQVDDASTLGERFGTGACDRIVETMAQRLRAVARRGDRFVRLSGWKIGFVAAPVPRLNLEVGIQLAARFQSVLEEPFRIDGVPVYLSFSVGFCMSRDCPSRDSDILIQATELALEDARRNGPSGIRAYSTAMALTAPFHPRTSSDAVRALDAGQIRAWFQPQVTTQDEDIAGLEALARWEHPEKGLIPPSDFLPALAECNAMERLGEVMLHDALSLLRDLETQGLHVPSVGVNFTQAELSNPKLAERLCWELDRFSLAPSRLAVEILENVVASGVDDMIARNVAALAEAGCRIELDDFGTGHASITSLRRFAIERIKIDRSFIVQCDQNPEQRKMLVTILTMARQLRLETLAEGVETLGEKKELEDLGCDYLQGFGIARPMPATDVAPWIEASLHRRAEHIQADPAPRVAILRRE